MAEKHGDPRTTRVPLPTSGRAVCPEHPRRPAPHFFLTGKPLTLWLCQNVLLKMAIYSGFTRNLPINSMVIFHSYVSLPEGMKQTLQQISTHINKWHRWIMTNMTSLWKNLPIHLIFQAFPNDDTSWQYCCPTTQTEVDGPWRIWDHQSLTNRSASFRINIFLCLRMSPGSHPGPTRCSSLRQFSCFSAAAKSSRGTFPELPAQQNSCGCFLMSWWVLMVWCSNDPVEHGKFDVYNTSSRTTFFRYCPSPAFTWAAWQGATGQAFIFGIVKLHAFAKWPQHQTWQSEPPSEEYIYRQFPHSKKIYGFWRSFQCHVLPCLDGVTLLYQYLACKVAARCSEPTAAWRRNLGAWAVLGGLGRCWVIRPLHAPWYFFCPCIPFEKRNGPVGTHGETSFKWHLTKSGFRLLAINNDPKQSVSCVSRSENSAKTDGHPWWSDDLYLYHFVPRSLCNFQPHWLIDQHLGFHLFWMFMPIMASRLYGIFWALCARTLRTVRTSNLNSRNSNCFKRSSPWRHEISWDFLLRFPSQWANGQNPITNTYVRGSLGSYFGTVLYPLWRNM